MMYKRLAFAILSTALCGCASTQTAYMPIEHRVAVPVMCNAPRVERPAMPADSVSGVAGMFEQVKALIATDELRKGYEARLEAALEACR